MARIYLRESTFDDCGCFTEWETQPAVTRFFTIDAGRNYEEVVTEFVKVQTQIRKPKNITSAGWSVGSIAQIGPRIATRT